MRAIYPAHNEEVNLAQEYAFPVVAGEVWVRSVFVSSLDGAATFNGRSGSLGNNADMALFALLRGLADVVLVGGETARTERYGPVHSDPVWAEVRLGRPPTPPIAVVSRYLRFDPYSPLFTQAPDYARTIVITCEAAPQKELDALRGSAEIVIAGVEEVDLAAAVEILIERGYSRISCEGGPRVLAQLAGAGVLNELCLTLSPLLLAGSGPRIANGAPIVDGLAMRLASVLEDDGYLFLRYVRPSSGSDPVLPSST
jgi:riboflavin biosynthesis pyrimidine reductase